MSDVVKILIVISCSIIAIIPCVYIILHKSAKHIDKAIELATNSGNYTKGVLVDARSYDWFKLYNIKIIKATYTFDADGKQQRKFVYFVRDYEINFPYPFNVQIYYSRRNPKNAYCREEQRFNLYINTVLNVAFMAVIIAAVCICSLILI